MKKISMFPLIKIATALLLLLSADRTLAASFLADDFNGSSPDLDKWTVNSEVSGSSVTQGSGYVELVNRGALITKSTFSTPVTIRARFQLRAVERSNLKFVLRTDGGSERRGVAVQLQCRTDWDGYIGQLAIFEIGTPTPATINFTTPLNLDQWYTVVIVDKGESIDLYFDGATTPSLTLASSFSAGQNVAIYNREGGAAGSWISEGGTARIDEIEILPTDTDNDGVNDYREDKDGTDPTDATSFNPLSVGLVAYYPFDGDIADGSGFGRSGTISGSGITSSLDRFFGTGGALSLSGSASDRAVIEPTPFNVNTNFTISFWCYGDPSGNGSYAATGTGVDRVDNIICTGLEFSGGLNIRYVSFQNPAWQVFAANLGQDGPPWGGFNIPEYVARWSHIAYVRSGSTWQTYFNGTLVSQGNLLRPITDMGSLRIGTHTFGANEDGGYSMVGSIDDMRIYQRSLSSTEIQRLFYSEAFSESQKSFLINSPSLMGHYSFSQYQTNRTNGQTDVTTNPAAFNLFTQTEYEGFGALQFSNGIGSVLSNPSSFNLFTQEEFDDNRTAGQSDVMNNPMTYGLYTSDSIMDLRMGGLMIQRQGTNAVVSFQPQTTTDLTLPFTNNGTPVTNTIPMPGNKGFIRINAKP